MKNPLENNVGQAAQAAGASATPSWAGTEALWIVALAAFSIVGHGHNYGVGNHTIYLLWIERLRDPAFVARDWYLSTAIMHPNVVQPLRWVGDWLGDSNAFLAALFVTRIILAGGVWRLARVLGGSGPAATLAVALVVLAPRVSLGGHYPSGSYFEASHLGVACAVVALALLAERRFSQAGLFVGLTGVVHLFLGAHLGAIACLAVLLERRPMRQRLANLARLAVGALIVSGPAIAAAGAGYFGPKGQGGLSGREVVEVLCFRHPHHHSPFSWPLAPSALALAYMALGAFLSWRAGRARHPLFPALYGYGVAAVVIGTVFVEWIPVSLVALFQFFRVTVLLVVWASAETALWLAPAFFRAVARGRWVTALLAAAAAASFRRPEVFLPCAAALAVFGKLAKVAAPGAASPVLASAPRPSQTWTLWAGRLRPSAPWLAAGAAAAGIALLVMGGAGWLNPPAARLGRPDHFRLNSESPNAQTRALCQWVREKTPPGAVFLSPPTLEGFRLWARRAEVVNFKHMTFTPPAMREWFERICRVTRLGRLAPGLPEDLWGEPEAVLPRLHEIRRRLGLNPQPALLEGYAGLSETNVRALAARYGFDYFIAPSGASYGFQRAGEAGGWTIWRLQMKG